MIRNTLHALWIAFLLASCAFGTQENETFPPTSSPTVAFTETPSPLPSATPYLTPTPPAVLITSGDWVSPYVALTFDMCQDPLEPAGYDAAIVDVLQHYNVRATFFMGGDWMRTHPEETRALGSNPNFELGNHSWSHPDFTKLADEKIAVELQMTDDLLFQLTGKHSRLFRPPYGLHNEETLSIVAQQGFYTIQWDSVSGDPDPKFDAQAILSEIRRTVKDGSIIIMHANGRGWHTAEALPMVIDYLQSRGYTLVTVSQLIGLEPLPRQ